MGFKKSMDYGRDQDAQKNFDIKYILVLVKISKEQAILGNYGESIKTFKKAINLIASHSSSPMDAYVKERWGQFQTDITKEFKTIVEIHKSMQAFKEKPMVDNGFYEINTNQNVQVSSKPQLHSKAPVEKSKAKPTVSQSTSQQNWNNPQHALQRQRSPKGHPHHQERTPTQQHSNPQLIHQNPTRQQSQPLGFPQQQKVQHNDHVPVNIVAPDQKINVKPKVSAEPPQIDRFGGLAPFQHHHMPQDDSFDTNMHNFDHNNSQDYPPPQQYNGDPFTGQYVNHQIYVKKPQNNYIERKDPDVWDAPTPQNQNKKITKPGNQWNAKKKLNMVKPISGPSGASGNVPNYGAQYQPNIKGAMGNQISKARNNVQQSKDDAKKKDRNYDKPWLLPEKKEAQTFLESVYPDGVGPDADLINMLERDVLDKNPQVQFDDIAELDDTKKLLQEAVLLPILMPQFFKGIRRPWKGICMFGPPGTGKTMLAKAVATQGKTTFFNVSASSLASKWKGESEKLVRILFEMARFYGPSTIFFDEIDALAGSRGGDHESSRRVKAELLIQMDGVSTCSSASANEAQDDNEAKKNVMVLAATNRPWDLDEAIRRRLEKRIYIPLPTDKGRNELFKINLRGLNLEETIDWGELVRMTEGYSGADISNVCRDAAMMPMRKKLQSSQFDIMNIGSIQDEIDLPLTMTDFLEAIRNIQRSVSQDQLKDYSEWMKMFGSV